MLLTGSRFRRRGACCIKTATTSIHWRLACSSCLSLSLTSHFLLSPFTLLVSRILHSSTHLSLSLSLSHTLLCILFPSHSLLPPSLAASLPLLRLSVSSSFFFFLSLLSFLCCLCSFAPFLFFSPHLMPEAPLSRRAHTTTADRALHARSPFCLLPSSSALALVSFSVVHFPPPPPFLCVAHSSI